MCVCVLVHSSIGECSHSSRFSFFCYREREGGGEGREGETSAQPKQAGGAKIKKYRKKEKERACERVGRGHIHGVAVDFHHGGGRAAGPKQEAQAVELSRRQAGYLHAVGFCASFLVILHKLQERQRMALHVVAVAPQCLLMLQEMCLKLLQHQMVASLLLVVHC